MISVSPTVFNNISMKLSNEKTLRQKREISNCPDYPSWVHDRFNLSWDFSNPEKLDSVREIK
jgi:hypothetical protein